jgi:hypothetical protein
MARASVTPQTPGNTGLTSASATFTAPTSAGAGNGWSFSNNGNGLAVFKNTDSSSKTLTFDVVGSVGGLTPADTTVTLPAASAGAPGYAYVKLSMDAYGLAAAVDVDNATGVTLAVFL